MSTTTTTPEHQLLQDHVDARPVAADAATDRHAIVQLDPDHKIHLDRDNFNNSKTAEPHGGASRKLTNYFTFATQWFTQLLAWWLT